MKKLLIATLIIASHTIHPMERVRKLIRPTTSALRLSFSQASLDLLHEAMKENPSLEKAQELLDQNADPNVHDRAHSIPPYSLMTATHYAAQNNSADLCLLLRKYGANINVFNIEIMTPLYLAAKQGHAETCRTLIRLNDLSSDRAKNNSINFNDCIDSLRDAFPSKNTTNAINKELGLQALNYSNEECLVAQKRLTTILLCLKKICPQIPKDLRKLILCWCETYHEDLPGDLHTLLASGIINLNSIPQHSQHLFTGWGEPYAEKLRTNKDTPQTLKWLLANGRNNNLTPEEVLKQQYTDRTLRNSLPKEDTRFNCKRLSYERENIMSYVYTITFIITIISTFLNLPTPQ